MLTTNKKYDIVYIVKQKEEQDMENIQVMFSSQSNEWSTPTDFFEELDIAHCDVVRGGSVSPFCAYPIVGTDQTVCKYVCCLFNSIFDFFTIVAYLL